MFRLCLILYAYFGDFRVVLVAISCMVQSSCSSIWNDASVGHRSCSVVDICTSVFLHKTKIIIGNDSRKNLGWAVFEKKLKNSHSMTYPTIIIK